MTDHHPITPPPELVLQWVGEIWHEGTPVQVAASDLHIARAAANWQLEQVIDWMRHSVHRDWYLEAIGHCGAEMGIDLVIEELKEAMRPTTTTETP